MPERSNPPKKHEIFFFIGVWLDFFICITISFFHYQISKRLIKKRSKYSTDESSSVELSWHRKVRRIKKLWWFFLSFVKAFMVQLSTLLFTIWRKSQYFIIIWFRIKLYFSIVIWKRNCKELWEALFLGDLCYHHHRCNRNFRQLQTISVNPQAISLFDFFHRETQGEPPLH